MPKPEIHYSVAFGMGFYIAEDGTLMSMPAVTDANGRTTMDIDNEIAVDEWDDPSAYSPSHMIVLATIMQIALSNVTMLISDTMPKDSGVQQNE